MAKTKWIQDAITKPGALRKALKVPAGKTIPAAKLAKAAKAPGKLGQRARLAQTLTRSDARSATKSTEAWLCRGQGFAELREGTTTVPHEGVCYDKPFLKEVIVRVDFSAPIEELGRRLPPSVKDAALKAFPISEPKRVKAQELQFGKGGLRHVESELTEWNFYGRDREKRLTISPLFMFITYSSYESFENLKADFSSVLTPLCEAIRDTTASRVGLRYVNNVGKDAEPFVWDAYFDNQLLGVLARFADQDHVNRVFHIVEFRYDDLGVKFQFGLANPDFPAMIRKPLFVLDFDGYAQGSQDLREILANVDRAHERIQELFERSITDDLRRVMNVRQPA